MSFEEEMRRIREQLRLGGVRFLPAIDEETAATLGRAYRDAQAAGFDYEILEPRPPMRFPRPLPTRFEMTATLEPPRQCGWCGYGPGPYLYEDRCWRCGEPPTEPFGELLSPRATLTLRWNTMARRPAIHVADSEPPSYQTAEAETLPLARAALLSTFLRRP